MIPDWLKVGARVRMLNNWPRVHLEAGMEGGVTEIDIDPVTNKLRWVTVVYDNHPPYPHGVSHYGWHIEQRHLVPIEDQSQN